MCALKDFANLEKHAISGDGFKWSLGTHQSRIVSLNVYNYMVGFTCLRTSGLDDISVEVIVHWRLSGRAAPHTFPKKDQVGLLWVGSPIEP